MGQIAKLPRAQGRACARSGGRGLILPKLHVQGAEMLVQRIVDVLATRRWRSEPQPVAVHVLQQLHHAAALKAETAVELVRAAAIDRRAGGGQQRPQILLGRIIVQRPPGSSRRLWG